MECALRPPRHVGKRDDSANWCNCTADDQRVKIIRKRSVRTIQEQSACFLVRGHTLQQSQSIATPIGSAVAEARRRQVRVDDNDLRQQRRNRAERVPQNRCQLRELLAFLAQLCTVAKWKKHTHGRFQTAFDEPTMPRFKPSSH